MKTKSEPISLREYVLACLPASRISKEEGIRLSQEFGEKINVSAPSVLNDDQWELTSQGWVGFIPFSEDLSFFLEPKVPLKNLFGMWEYAYRLKSFQILSDLYLCESLQQFYEQLASVLARRILDRSRKGYYRAYISRTEDLSYLRGRLDLNQMKMKPWEPRPRCNYQENTADVEENQILAWTLYSILRSGFCTERVLPIIRNSYRNIGHIASLQPFKPKDCLGRFYNRLNQDYQPLHALSRFFLENTGPSYEIGDRTMLPFLVNMAGLYELFVAEWLFANLPKKYEINSQELLEIDQKREIFFKIDLVIYETDTKRPVCVLDTKYKSSESPFSDDIAQVGFYAMAKKCREAILVYPKRISHPMDETVNEIRIRTATFSLEGDLEEAGKKFLTEIFGFDQIHGGES
jgi:5-methylcytosine-specific restriction enzyme subunit McrC